MQNLLNEKESVPKTLKTNNWHDPFSKWLQKPFAETRARELYGNTKDTGPSARKKSRSSGGESLVYPKEKIEKETKLKENEPGLRRNRIRTASKTLTNCPKSAKSTFN